MAVEKKGSAKILIGKAAREKTVAELSRMVMQGGYLDGLKTDR